MESSGPDTKVRGPASHIYERYLQLARDAASSGDRVLSENYSQHADHYFRLVRTMQPAAPLQTNGDRFGSDGEYEDEGGGPDGEGQENEAAGAEGEDLPGAEFPQGQQQQQQQQQYDRGEGGDFRRRRGRRNRFRPNPGEGEGAEAREGGGEPPERVERAERPDRPERSEQRSDRPERRERAPREQREDEPQEGFTHGPKPAFLRSD